MKKYILLAAVSLLSICAVITYFGRIYFPDNFEPDKVSFFENYWVLTLGLCFCITVNTLVLLALWWTGRELSRELIRSIKSLFN